VRIGVNHWFTVRVKFVLTQPVTLGWIAGVGRPVQFSRQVCRQRCALLAPVRLGKALASRSACCCPIRERPLRCLRTWRRAACSPSGR
jgi:hypothetical protein